MSSWILAACGLWLIGLGSYFIFVRPALLPEDVRFMSVTLLQVQAALPGLQGWLRAVFLVMGGFMIGSGVLTVLLGLVGVPLRRRGTAWVIALAGLPTVGLMCAANFQLHSDFRWLLLVPALAWLGGFVLYLAKR